MKNETETSNSVQIQNFESYKEFLRVQLAQAGRGEATRLAEAMGCQKSYLSQVLTGKPHLTQDQLFLAAEHWGLNDLERESLMLLLEAEKSINPAYRESLEKKRRALRKDLNKLGQILERDISDDSSFPALYFSTWVWQAIHFATACPGLQTPEKIGQTLSLAPAKVEEILTVLAERGLIQKERQRWKYLAGQVHVPATSPVLHPFAQSWRNRACEHGALHPGLDLHYTGVQAISKKDAGLLAQMLRETLRRFHEQAGPSDAEVLINLNVDYWVMEP